MPSPKRNPRAGTHGRRLITMVVIAGAVALPAGILRLACVGDLCREPASVSSRAPFCSLPGPLRGAVAAGFRKGRSPEVFGVTTRQHRLGDRVTWPYPGSQRSAAFALGGAGVGDGTLPEGAALDDVAATIAAASGLERPHPEVRSGEPWGALIDGSEPRLVLEVVWKEVAGAATASDSFQHVGALGAEAELSTGTSPQDPAALMATLGSGAIPARHGITGHLIRDDRGRLVKAWGPQAPGSVIAMLADDIEMLSDGRAMTGLVGGERIDRGLVGSDWYLSGHQPDLKLSAGAGPLEQVRRAEKLLATGYGDDDLTDLLAVTMTGDEGEADQATLRLMEAAEAAAPGRVLYVLLALPSPEPTTGQTGLAATDIAAQIEEDLGAPVIEALAGGGFFTDQDVLTKERIGEDEILAAMGRVRAPDGRPLFADRFTGIAITFERYC